MRSVVGRFGTVVQDLESVVWLRESSARHGNCRDVHPSEGTDYHCSGMHIINNADLISTETPGKRALTHDVRQCDAVEWEADEVRKAIHTWRVCVQSQVPDVEQISSGRGVDAISKDFVL